MEFNIGDLIISRVDNQQFVHWVVDSTVTNSKDDIRKWILVGCYNMHGKVMRSMFNINLDYYKIYRVKHE